MLAALLIAASALTDSGTTAGPPLSAAPERAIGSAAGAAQVDAVRGRVVGSAAGATRAAAAQEPGIAAAVGTAQVEAARERAIGSAGGATRAAAAQEHGVAAAVGAGRAAGGLSETDLRVLQSVIADTARLQLVKMDDAWPVEQRDCAGFVRFVYRRAYNRVAPGEVQRGLFLTRGRAYSAFADAETLLSGGSFRSMGRETSVRSALASGDLVAFRRDDGEARGAVYHLMLVVRPQDPAHDDTWVLYHPGSVGQGVRGGRLRDLERDAPREWQPVPENPAFVGYFRFQEWMR